MNDTTIPPNWQGRTELKATVMPPRNCDQEVADMMDRLSTLQTWCALMASKDLGAVTAIGIVQDVRCLIVERLFTKHAPLGVVVHHVEGGK
jgi:hypothetical protein